ncbi:hypothetical protein H257_07736 [Aphanomyces astaci]|uniref:Uncharacterized protein n=1 Tax=Aphanomyces astaci TaxID=112090 RepID=W4GIT6_APHAT|nr:hypothetical protein H257_07736 [Aphanomyces astaci]ETV78949.1 hypothetical protein H257_07736 [Aphanomyces astaci]|eukprot:XP_009831668.1 hypothetical protein H257_07736 [Aphanomyces astaci]
MQIPGVRQGYTLVTLKHYNAWDNHALDFRMKAPTFGKIVHRVLDIVEPVLYQHYVKPSSMTDQVRKGHVFSNFPSALYCTDVKFQPSYRPTGRFDECKQQGKRLSIHEKNLIRAYYASHVPIKTTAVQQWVTEQFGHTLHITTIRRILRDTRKIETNNIQEKSAKGREALVGTKRNAKRTSLSGQGAKESISFKNELLSFMKVVRREKHILTARAMLHQIADDRNGAIRTGFAGVFWKKYHDYPLYDILNVDETGVVYYDMLSGKI